MIKINRIPQTPPKAIHLSLVETLSFGDMSIPLSVSPLSRNENDANTETNAMIISSIDKNEKNKESKNEKIQRGKNNPELVEHTNKRSFESTVCSIVSSFVLLESMQLYLYMFGHKKHWYNPKNCMLLYVIVLYQYCNIINIYYRIKLN